MTFHEKAKKVVMEGGDEMAKAEGEGLSCDVVNTVFVAVGKNSKHAKTTLSWASGSFPGKIICLLHVHQQPKLFNSMEERFSIMKVKKMAVRTWREVERRKMHKLLNQYLVILGQLGVQGCKVWIEMDNIEKGIVRVISQLNVRRLVMGAAADEHHTENLSEHKSKKAAFVCEQAHDLCHIWFTSNGHLIYARCGDGSFHIKNAVISPLAINGSDIEVLNTDEDPDEGETVPREPTYQNLENYTMPEEEVVEECESLKETNLTRELENSLARQRQELEKMRDQYNNYAKELQIICDQKPELESRLIKYKSIVEELEKKIIQAVNLMVTFKEKRDKLLTECDDRTRQNNVLWELLTGNSASPSFEFSLWEINDATKDFDPSMKIGDGKHGSVYKGILHNLKVAIKMLSFHGCEGHLSLKNEARFLSMVRHPNLVTLVGTCAEPRSLIYEYLENGSLEDRLSCQGKTSPISWKNRIKIANEICTALVFLHSNEPSIIHGNLKATNVLLDANFVSKISDMNIYRLVRNGSQTTHLNPVCDANDLETSAYVAPKVFETGEVTPYSDVYSFGVILLRLLTGRPAVGLLKNVKCALEMNNFSSILDSNAGKWPVEPAKNLARLALRCCEFDFELRADLLSEVLSEIELMKAFCNSSDLEAKGSRRVPSYFVCPIFQEIMKDPQIAPDGFTYEGDAIKGWFNSGHKTSPMTNLKLDSCDLLPNYALFYAIQEWEQQS